MVEDAQVDSHRLTGLSGDIVELLQSFAEMGVSSVDLEPVALRGERLALMRVAFWVGESCVEFYSIGQTDEEGLGTDLVTFDLEDLDSAYAELDARYLAGEGAESADTVWPLFEGFAAFNRQDWSAVREVFADGLQVIDNRPPPRMYAEVDGPDAFVVALKTIWELAAHVSIQTVTLHRMAHGALVQTTRTTTVMADGGEAENLFVAFVEVGHGQITRFEFFAEDDLDRATARFEELCSEREAALPPSSVSAVRVIATRGVRLSLEERRPVEDTDSRPDSELIVVERDQAGSIVAEPSFPSTALAAALGYLDDTYLASLDPEEATVWLAHCGLTEGYNARDWETMLAPLADDAVIVDDRLIGWGKLDRGSFIERVQELIRMAPDVFLAPTAVHSITPQGAVCTFQITGTVPGGGEFAMFFETTAAVQGAKIVRLEMLPEGRVEEAMRRLSSPAG